MDNKEVVTMILKTYGCSSAKEIANLAYRKYNIQLTPQKVSGVLRPLIAAGLAASSKNGSNTTVYWLVERNW